jgi:hypothetical protein
VNGYHLERVAGKTTVIRHRSPRLVRLFQTILGTDKFIFKFVPDDIRLISIVNATITVYGNPEEKTLSMTEKELSVGQTVELHFSVHPLYRITDRGKV